MSEIPSRIVGVLAMLLLALSTAACSNTMTWEEEVKIADGRMIRVLQKHRYEVTYDGQSVGKLMRESWLIFKFPEFSSEEIVWHENLLPLILNVDQGKLFIVGLPLTRLEILQYGQPVPSYVAYVYERGNWMRIPFEKIPTRLYETNLWLDTVPDKESRKISWSDKLNQKNDIGYSSVVKILDPKYKASNQ